MDPGETRNHVIVTDSRGTLLQNSINEVKDPYSRLVKVVYKSGATYEEIVNIAINHAKINPDNVYYILGGTNNITHRVYDDPVRKFMFTERTPEELEAYIEQIMDAANARVKRECQQTNFVFCPMTGLNLSVNIKDFDVYHQEAVDRAMVASKHKAVQINTTMNLPTPWTSAHVHHLRRGKHIHCYDRLSGDGLHPSEGLLKYWADLFVKFAGKLYV